jgi:NADH dehydrogenase [ubiquinone] 1 alpha subcomplex assembly factor 3
MRPLRALRMSTFRRNPPKASVPSRSYARRPSHPSRLPDTATTPLNSFVCSRCLHTSQALYNASRAPKSRDRGPASKEDTQTDFGMLNVLGNTPPPASSIDVTTATGFVFSNQLKVAGSGVLLVGGEVFRWKPWIRPGRKEGTAGGGGEADDVMRGKLLNEKGQWDVDAGAWGLLDMVWPKPGMFKPRVVDDL